MKKGKRPPTIVGEGTPHIPRKECPHLLAEVLDNHQEDLADELERPLLPWARRVAREAGRNLPKRKAIYQARMNAR